MNELGSVLLLGSVVASATMLAAAISRRHDLGWWVFVSFLLLRCTPQNPPPLWWCLGAIPVTGYGFVCWVVRSGTANASRGAEPGAPEAKKK